MSDTPTTRNRFRKPEVGANLNLWGGLLNGTGGSDLVDSSVDGVESYTLSGSKTLTSANYTDSEAIQRVQNITGGTGGTITIPSVEKNYIVRNASSGNVIITTGGGATATILPGNIAQVFSDGTNVYLGMISDYGSVQLKSSATASGPTHLVNKALLDATAFSAALPGQAGNAGKRVGTDGSNASWTFITSGEVVNALGYEPTSVGGLEGAQSVSDFKVGLSINNLDNTSDTNKPVSTAQQNALNLKADLASPTFTGTPAAPTAAGGTNSTQIATTAFVQNALSTPQAISSIYAPTGAYILADHHGSIDTLNDLTPAANTLYARPISKRMTTDALVTALRTAAASSTFIIGLYDADGTDYGPNTLLAQSGTLSGNATGNVVHTLSGDIAVNRPMWLVIQTGGTAPRFYPSSASPSMPPERWPQTSLAAAFSVNCGFSFTRSFAALPSTFPATARTDVAQGVLPVMAMRQT